MTEVTTLFSQSGGKLPHRKEGKKVEQVLADAEALLNKLKQLIADLQKEVRRQKGR